MKQTDTREVGSRTYEAGCVASLLVLVLTLLQRGYGSWCLLPLVVGLIGIYGRLRIGPPLLLLALAFQLLYDHLYVGGTAQQTFDLHDLLQAGAVLGFVASHYRLQGLTHTLVPLDPRERGLRKAAQAPPRRGAQRAVPAGEIVLLFAFVAIWALAAQLLWAYLPADQHDFWRLPPHVWRMITLAWCGAMAVLVAASLLRHLGWERLTREEAALYLQDVLWQETRGEQRRAGRWLAWARLRYQRRQG